jgi:cytochrome c-type biogenesis protein CcmE
MSTPGKLVIGAAVIACATGYMAYLGAASSWQYYVTVDECIPAGEKLSSGRLRVNGKVVPGSLKIAADRNRAELALEGSAANLTVTCTGPVPDNLAEGMDVVVEGQLDESGILRGDKLLTRCASKYESKRPAESSSGTAAGPDEGSP